MRVVWILLLMYSAQGLAEVDCDVALAEHLDSDLSLSYQAFDQTMGHGWRRLADQGCYLEAAQLIERYSRENEAERRSGLVWHRFQMLAYAEKYEAALELVEQVLMPAERQAEVPLRWNDYVLATVAFLEQDMESLRHHREQLAASVDDHPGNELNLSVVDRLIKGFDRSYQQAYDMN